MRFGRKGKTPARREATGRGTSSGAQRQNGAGFDLGQGNGTDGLPGRAGYANGPRTPLPTFFHMRRPDGRPDPVYKKKLWFG